MDRAFPPRLAHAVCSAFVESICETAFLRSAFWQGRGQC